MSWKDWSLHNTILHEFNRERISGNRPDHNYASDASIKSEGKTTGACLRAGYFRRTRIPPTDYPGPALKMRQLLGEMVESTYIDCCKRAGIFENEQVSFYDPQFNISGRVDAIIRPPGTSTPLVLEVKSYYSYQAAKEIQGTASEPGKPKIQNLMQIALYLWLFRATVPGGKLYYLARDSGHESVFNVELVELEMNGQKVHQVYVGLENNPTDYAGFLIEEMLLRFQELNQAVENKNLPIRDYKLFYNDKEIERYAADGEISQAAYKRWKKNNSDRPGDFSCSYCSWRTKCWSDVISQRGFSWSIYE